MNISMNARKYFIRIAYIFGITLVLINIYGKTQSIRHPDLVSFDKYGGEFNLVWYYLYKINRDRGYYPTRRLVSLCS